MQLKIITSEWAQRAVQLHIPRGLGWGRALVTHFPKVKNGIGGHVSHFAENAWSSFSSEAHTPGGWGEVQHLLHISLEWKGGASIFILHKMHSSVFWLRGSFEGSNALRSYGCLCVYIYMYMYIYIYTFCHLAPSHITTPTSQWTTHAETTHNHTHINIYIYVCVCSYV